MKVVLRPFLYVSFILLSLSTRAQIDTDFWFAAPEVSNSLGDQPIFLRFITYGSPATVTVNQPANGGFTPVNLNIAANSIDSLDLTTFLASVESPAANTVANNGLHITSTAPIAAYYELKSGVNKELFGLKGRRGIGTNFYTPFPTFWANGATTPASFNSIDIVATQNGTTVLITPRTAIVGHAANATFSVTLNAGQTYSARDVNTSAATSLAGSIVSSDKPVAVTVYNGAQSNAGCMSTVGDQITTTESAGTDFIIHRGNATNERVYVLATQNGTTVTKYGASTSSTLINWSETHEHVITDTVTYIKTNKPVYVFHVSGKGCKLSGAQLPNVFCAGTYSSAFTRSHSDSLAVRLYVRSGFENQFTLNGATGVINASAFKTVPGTSGAFKSALIYFNNTTVPVNTHQLVENSGDIFGMSVFTGSAAKGSAYAFCSEYISYPFVDAGPDDTVCANVPLTLNGVVGGGSITGTWSNTGFGSFQNGFTNLNNAYIPSDIDTVISPIEIILSSTGPCPVQRDTLVLHVTPAPIVNAGANQTVCANNATVNLNGSIGGGASTGIWSTLGSGTFSPGASTLNATYNPSAADTAAGQVILVLTSTNPGACSNETDTMVVTITGQPYADAGPATQSVCINNNIVSLTGTISGSTSTGKWTSSGSGIFSPNNLTLSATYQPSASDLSAGTVTLYLESTGNGLCFAAKDSIVITFTPAPVVSAGTNLIACTNDAGVQLTGSVTGPTSTGIWSGGAGSFSPSNTALNATYMPTAGEISSGNIFLTLTSTNNGGCNAVNSSMQINFVAPPFANFNFTDVCEGLSTPFTDFSLNGYGTNVQWDWTFGDGDSSSVHHPTHTYATDGTYSVTLITTSSVGCSDTITQNVTVYDKPVASYTYTSSCNGSQIVIDFTDNSTVNNGTINSWYYDFGGMGNVSTPNPTQLFIGSGNFTITHIVSTTQGCSDTLINVITIPPRPEAGFYYNSSNGLNVAATFNFIDTSSNATIFSWDFGDGGSSSAQNPSHIFTQNGSYYVTQFAYDAFGCVDSATVLIRINTITNEISTLIPNAISPNGDGRNDVWKLSFINLLYPNATVEVFNRWGQRLFFSEGYNTPWDGTYNGDLVAPGTYYYVINLNDPSQPDPFKGTILVLMERP